MHIILVSESPSLFQYVDHPELVFVVLTKKQKEEFKEIEEIRVVSRPLRRPEDIAILCLKVPLVFSYKVN